MTVTGGMPAGAAALLLAPEASAWSSAELLEQLVRALREQDGVPVDRMSCSLPLLHPELRSVQLIWSGEGQVQEHPRGWAPAQRAMYAKSPIRTLFEGEARVVRHRIGAGHARPYEILEELHGEGFTDYLATVIPAAKPWDMAPVSWATRAEGGFTEAQVEGLLGSMPLLSLVLGVHAHRHKTRALLTTYLGRDAASRVLDGHVRRGDVFDMDAAICFCDLRDFTGLSQRLSREELLGLLDDAFGAVVGAVEAEGGEVLKFIGDAVLAVFPAGEDDDSRRRAAARAYAAARSALARAEAAHAERQARGKAPLQIGLSLHLGRVAYGNIGGTTRLDFTVIGAAVNLASRLEGLCRSLGYPIVMSGSFAELLPGPAPERVAAGAQVLKGIPEPVEVVGVRGG